MEHIRPHQVFAMVDPGDREFTAQLPRPIGGSVTALEACLVIALLKAVRPTTAFEFGTYLGDTTRLIAKNLPSDAGVVYTLDLDSTEGVDFLDVDATLAKRALAAERDLSDSGAEVVQLLGDSYDLDPTPYEGRMEFVFIDANHTRKYVEKDTSNGLRMVSTSGPAAVIWHDYDNPVTPDVTEYLDSVSDGAPLYHIEETFLVFRLQELAVTERQVPE
jgi:predicted O-methyltransferase YrrM